MKLFQRTLVGLISLAATAACNDPVAPVDPADRFIGRWEKITADLPPVSLEVRREGGVVVGQVWLSGVTYTWPATFHDSTMVLANPVSSALAPFSAMLIPAGKMRATITGQPDVQVTLVKMIRID